MDPQWGFEGQDVIRIDDAIMVFELCVNGSMADTGAPGQSFGCRLLIWWRHGSSFRAQLIRTWWGTYGSGSCVQRSGVLC